MPIAHVDRTQHALHLSWRRKMSGENIRFPVIGGARDFEIWALRAFVPVLEFEPQ